MKFHLKTWSLLSGMTLSLALVGGCSPEAAPEPTVPTATPKDEGAKTPAPTATETAPATPPPAVEAPAPAPETPKAEAPKEEAPK